MNLKLLWQAWKLTVALLGMVCILGLVTQRPSLVEAAFGPLFIVPIFLGSCIGAWWWRNR
jgi:hypothetical protein